ncbi:MAG: hypothetical protein WBC71_06130, partial [Salaquimonas sp.]
MMKMPELIETGEKRYQPDHDFTYGFNPDYLINQQRLALAIGTTAILLPTVLFLSTIFTEIC